MLPHTIVDRNCIIVAETSNNTFVGPRNYNFLRNFESLGYLRFPGNPEAASNTAITTAEEELFSGKEFSARNYSK
jgi:hypothetical protein